MVKRYDFEDSYYGSRQGKACDDGDYVSFSDYDKLHYAASKLRASQKLYMKNRGDESYGVKVGVAASELDKILGEE